MIKILIVDDEVDIRNILTEFLKLEGDYEILRAEDGQKALEIFNNNSIDLVFMDIKMPVLDGIEVFRQMKQFKPQVKVVIMTGMPDEKTFDRALAVSEEVVEGFLAKPFNQDELHNCLQIVLAGDRHMVFPLPPTKLDALGKCTTTAVEAVSKAFSQIVQKEIKINLQNLNVIPLGQIAKPLEEPGVLSVSLASQFSGSISGIVLFLVAWKGGLTLLDLVKRVSPGTTKSFDEANQAYLKSLGTVLIGTYLKALAQELNLSIRPGLPNLIFEHRNNLIKSITKEITSSWTAEGEYIFTIETELSMLESSLNCWFCLIPTTTSLKSVLRALGTLK